VASDTPPVSAALVSATAYAKSSSVRATGPFSSLVAGS